MDTARERLDRAKAQASRNAKALKNPYHYWVDEGKNYPYGWNLGEVAPVRLADREPYGPETALEMLPDNCFLVTVGKPAEARDGNYHYSDVKSVALCPDGRAFEKGYGDSGPWVLVWRLRDLNLLGVKEDRSWMR